jgi:hypothetical protein
MKIKLLVIAVIMLAASSAFASLSYDVTIDTTKFGAAGQDGYLYFQFNPGGDSYQAATASVTAFSTDGVLGAQDTVNIMNGSAVTGTLPGTVTLANTNAINDYNHAIHFGNTMTFTVVFDGTAVTAPNGTSLNGSTFSLDLFQDALGATPFLNQYGYSTAVAFDLNTNGTVTDATPTPIPAAAWLLGTGLMGLAGIRRRMNA